MATYSTNLALTLMATGEQSNTWGDTTNTNLGTLLEQAISGYVTQAITDGSSANTTITIPNGATGVARNMFIEMTGALSFSTTSLIVPANKKMYFVFNNTSGGFAVTVKVSGQTGILVPNGKKVILTCNGTDIVEAHTAIVGNATIGGTLGVTGTLSGGTSGTGYSFSGSAPATSLTLDASGNLGIGTSSPAYRLDSRVTTSASVVSAINLDASGNSNGDGSAVNFSRAGNALSGVARISAVKAEVSNNETDLVFSNFAAGSLTEKMRIAGATGNVGIGTASPATRLHVNSTGAAIATIQSTLAAGNTNVETRYISTNRTWAVGQNIIQTSSIFEIADVTAGATRLAIDSSGNLGIGTSSPSTFGKLAVYGSGTAPVIGAFLGSNSPTTGATLADISFGARTDGTVTAIIRAIANDNGNGTDGQLTFYTADNTASAAASEKMRLGSSGNLGIGTTSPLNKLDVRAASDVIANYQTIQAFSTDSAAIDLGGGIGLGGFYSTTTSIAVFGNITGRKENGTGGNFSGYLAFGTNNNSTGIVERARIDSSGNLGVGTTSPSVASGLGIVVNGGAGQSRIALKNNNTGDASGDGFQLAVDTSSNAYIDQRENAALIFNTNNAERARIDSSGTLLVGCTGGGASGNAIVTYGSGGDIQRIFGTQASSSIFSLISMFSGATTPSSPTGTLRVNITTNGGIANFQANDSNLSDRREKTNFAPAGLYLDKICAIPVQTFNYIDQNMEEDDGLTLGVVAQDVQAVAPELVMESNWASKDDEPKMRLSIYQTDLQYALMKCIQEQQAIITALTTRITALEAR